MSYSELFPALKWDFFNVPVYMYVYLLYLSICFFSFSFIILYILLYISQLSTLLLSHKINIIMFYIAGQVSIL